MFAMIRMVAGLTAVGVFCCGAGAIGAGIPVPQIDGEWWPVAGNPDLGELTGDKQQPVDFAIWQAAGGTWQIWSCIRHTRCGGHTRLFHRWESKQITDSHWQPKGIAMQADPTLGESLGVDFRHRTSSRRKTVTTWFTVIGSASAWP